MKLKAQKEEIESRRAISAGTCRQQIDSKLLPKTSNLSQSVSTLHSPTRTYEQKENISPTTQPSPSSHNRMSMCSKLQNVFKKPGTATTHKTEISISTKTSEFIVPTPETYSIPVCYFMSIIYCSNCLVQCRIKTPFFKGIQSNNF